MSEEPKCDRCHATDLVAFKILDPVTSKLFVVFKCNGCHHLRWVDADSRCERASGGDQTVDGHQS